MGVRRRLGISSCDRNGGGSCDDTCEHDLLLGSDGVFADPAIGAAERYILSFV